MVKQQVLRCKLLMYDVRFILNACLQTVLPTSLLVALLMTGSLSQEYY